MNFLAILICLTIERFTAIGKKTREFHLCEYYLRWVLPVLKKLGFNAYLKLLLILVPITFVVGFVFWALTFFYDGVFSVVFAIVVLFYCLGTFDVSHDRGHGHALKMANQNIFAVLFWFIIFSKWGLMAAIVYRMIDFTAKHADDDQLTNLALKLQQYLDWVSIRVLTLSIGFVSHFAAIIPFWMSHVLSDIQGNEVLLDGCGDIAIEADVSSVDRPQKISRLIDRVLIFWLVIIALTIML